jgi:hypothetical protein
MAQVGLRIIGHQAKGDQQGLFQLIGLHNGMFQGVIDRGPLRLLHPIKNKIAFRDVSII